MKLPIRILISSFLGSVFLFVTVAPIFAHYPSYYRPTGSNTPTNYVQATPSVAASIEGGQVLGCAIWNPLSWGECVSDAASEIIYFGVGIVQKVLIRQGTDCDPDDTDCQKSVVRDIQNGVPVAEMEHQGALVLAAGFLDSAKTMPVPIDSKMYFASINPFKSAQASGVDDLAGSGKLLEFWQIIRNASYALMVVVLVIIGFMIMLRIPINPRTVVTAENSLPRVVVSLILITFSFAISGLMIDIGRIAIQLVGWIGGEVGIQFEVLFLKLITIVFLVGLGGWAIGWGLLLVMLLLVLFLLIILLMIGWKMVVRMAMFIVLTLFSPLVFLVGAIPQGEGLMIGWFKRQISNILAIPAMILLITVALILANVHDIPTPIEDKVNPFGLTSMILGPMIAIGVLMMATKVPEMIDDALGIRESGKGHGLTGAGMVGAAIMAKRLGISGGAIVDHIKTKGLTGAINRWRKKGTEGQVAAAEKSARVSQLTQGLGEQYMAKQQVDRKIQVGKSAEKVAQGAAGVKKGGLETPFSPRKEGEQSGATQPPASVPPAQPRYTAGDQDSSSDSDNQESGA